MTSHRTILALFVAALVVLPPAPVFAGAGQPQGVPDLTDPAVLKQFVPVSLSGLNGDPDFPVLLFARRGEGVPQFLLLIVDARNGKETWSLREDAAVFYALFADPTTIHRAYLDKGFAATGAPSGEFVAAGPETAEDLVARLGEGYVRSRGLARIGTEI